MPQPGRLMMPVDNRLYDRPGDIWWDDREPLSILRTAVNPGRFGYFRQIIATLGIDPSGLRLLDVGCGGGLLAEEFVRLGCRVIGIDPSVPSIATARRHAARAQLDIAYLVGAGEAIPLAGGAFDLVTCCDVLEHVVDANRVIAEIARVLRPGGVFFFDTINRTWLSRLVVIGALQEWRPTRLAPPNLHDWRLFITPRELRALLRRHGLAEGAVVGLKPRPNPLTLIGLLLRAKRGRLSCAELGTRTPFGPSRDTSISYMGYARKRR